MRRFLALLHARNIEFIRDKSSLAWNFIFPLLMIAGFAVVFSNDNKTLYKAGLLEGDVAHFSTVQHVEVISYGDSEAALSKLRHHQLDIVLDEKQKNYWVNPHAPNGYITENVFKGLGLLSDWQRHDVEGQALRYVDWVLPGVLGMNMMFSCLFGVGYVIVRYRKNGVLKRLKATPLSAVEFLAAQICSRMFLTLGVVSLLFIACNALFHFFMLGSYALLFLVAMLGTLAMISVSLLMASRTRSEELAGGLLNMISWPMMFLSEVWFSLEGAPDWVHALAQIFPLTHMIGAARDIMINGAGFADILPHVLVLLTMLVICLGMAAYLFRWDQD